jgi:hypothetical protein
VLGNDGNEIRQIEKSPAATPAHRNMGGLRIGSSKPLVNTREQTANLAIRSLQDERRPIRHFTLEDVLFTN